MAYSQPQVFELERAVREWAWREYDKTATKKQRQLREKETKKKTKLIEIHIDWADVHFHDETNWPRLADDRDDNEANDASAIQRPDTGVATCSILFNTKFSNDTEDPQEYTMRTEKTTSSTCSTDLETCFTKGYEMSVSLKSPCEIFEANAGYHREMSLTNSSGQVFEEELQWGVESQIKVKARHMAEAQLVVNEKKRSGRFTIESSMWGMIYVTFTNLRSNNELVKATGHDIAEVVKDHVERENRKGVSYPFVKVDDGRVVIVTKGQCKFRYGIKQEVRVHQTPL